MLTSVSWKFRRYSYNDGAIGILWELVISSLEGVGPVDEIQVEVVKPQVLKGVLTSAFHVVRVVLRVPKLGGHEQVGPGRDS